MDLGLINVKEHSLGIKQKGLVCKIPSSSNRRDLRERKQLNKSPCPLAVFQDWKG